MPIDPQAQAPSTEEDLSALLALTDEEATLGALARLLYALAAKPDESEVHQLLGDALLEARLMERVRCAAYARERGVSAAKAAQAADRAGQPIAANGARLVAKTAADLATLLMQPPGPACRICHGARTVPARVQLAGGAPTRLPCPACAAQAEEASPVAPPEGG